MVTQPRKEVMKQREISVGEKKGTAQQTTREV